MVWAWQPPKCFQSSLSSHMQLFLEDPGHTMEVFHVPWSSYRSSHHEWDLPMNGYTNPRKWIDDRPQCFWSLKTCIVPLLEASRFLFKAASFMQLFVFVHVFYSPTRQPIKWLVLTSSFVYPFFSLRFLVFNFLSSHPGSYVYIHIYFGVRWLLYLPLL